MASAVGDERSGGVEFARKEDSITARDRETGPDRGGRTRSEAVANLAEVLALEKGADESIDDPEEFLGNLGIDPDEAVDDEPTPHYSETGRNYLRSRALLSR